MEFILETFLIFKTMFSNIDIKENVYDRFDYAEITQLAPPENELRMMGYVIVTNFGKVIVVDGGLYSNGKRLEEIINSYGGKVDTWFITHYHSDHTGAFDYIVNKTNVKIDNVYQSLSSRNMVEKYEKNRLEEYDRYYNSLNHEKLKEKVHEVEIGDIIKVGNVKCEILSIKNEQITNNFGNNQSVVIRMNIGESVVIFLGDTGLEEESFLLNNVPHEKLKADYVQISHHGQKGASNKLYEVINPSYAFWPCSMSLYDNNLGKGFNTASFKSIETRKWMEKIGTKNYIAGKGEQKIIIK